MYVSDISNPNYKHGCSKTRLYRIYNHMKERCCKDYNKDYEYYGGRGIKVCSEWLGKHGFARFQKWAIQNGYAEDLTLDRIDVNGNYEPLNCRWITIQEQSRNRRDNRLYLHNGKMRCISEIAKIEGIRQDTLWRRLERMSLEQAVAFTRRRTDITYEKCKNLREQGYSTREIAEALNCSCNTVERRISEWRRGYAHN